jgi:NADPH-dependent 2,4-dienoyl-CoA reductase/sulfur reductase-like enzyme
MIRAAFSAAARDRGGPIGFEGASAGRQAQHRGVLADQVEQAGGVRFSLGDEPVERVTFADHDRVQPGRGLLGFRLVRTPVERAVLDRGDHVGAVVPGEGEPDRTATAYCNTRPERLKRGRADLLRRAEACDPTA